jgi:xanthine dehydrogenase accessory factor
MSDLRSLVEASRALPPGGAPYFVATVVNVRGSSYRKLGARMLFTAEQWLAGSVSGGCLERDIVARAPFLTRLHGARLVTFDSADDERSGSGCEGIIDVLVERPDQRTLADPMVFVSRCLERECSGIRFTAFRSSVASVMAGMSYAELTSGEVAASIPPGALREQLRTLARNMLCGARSRTCVIHQGGVDLLAELVVPPIHLFVFGTAHDAVPLVTFARTLGWTVSVYEPRATPTTRTRFRGANQHLDGKLEDAIRVVQGCARPAAVLMSHHYERDLTALRALIPTRTPYIGLLGSRNRSARLLADAAGTSGCGRLRTRVHAPVGLAIGAESPSEIALAIVAQVQAVCGLHAASAAAMPRAVSSL